MALCARRIEAGWRVSAAVAWSALGLADRRVISPLNVAVREMQRDKSTDDFGGGAKAPSDEAVNFETRQRLVGTTRSDRWLGISSVSYTDMAAHP